MRGRGSPSSPRTRALLTIALLSISLGFVQPTPASSTTSYGSPSWLPFRGTTTIGCARNNGCGPNAHGYWAIDIPLTKNQPVYATGKGQVVIVQDGQGGNCDQSVYASPADCPEGKKGNALLIDHGAFGYTLYGHFTSIAVHQGDWVTEGTVLGGAGDSGWAPPGFVHVHYEQWSPGDLLTVVNNPPRIQPNPMSGCISSTKVTYPAHLGGATWDDCPPSSAQLENDGGCNPDEASCVSGFVDVLPTHPFCPDIKWMVDNHVTTGYPDGLFWPGRTTSRQAAVAWLYRYAGSPTGPFPNPGFSDVSSSSQFYDAISWAVSQNIITGYGDGTFKPERNVSRQAFVAFLYRLAGSPGAGPNRASPTCRRRTRSSPRSRGRSPMGS